MSKKPSLIQIEECPLCHQTHDYQLYIKRVTVMGLSEEQESEKTMICLFTCPQRQEDFEADIPLKQQPNEKILSIKAEGVSP